MKYLIILLTSLFLVSTASAEDKTYNASECYKILNEGNVIFSGRDEATFSGEFQYYYYPSLVLFNNKIYTVAISTYRYTNIAGLECREYIVED